LDGYGDVVVGEPYGGIDNRGAIYIYYGMKDGVEDKYSQVIYSENLEKPVRTFGWSVSGGLDLDGNNYPDIVVGAYESNTVMYFRSRPVINIYSEINFLSESINLQNKTCTLSDGSAVACSELKICCMYTGLGSWSQHNFLVHLLLDDKKKKNPRLFFLELENKHTLNWTINIVKDKHHCRQIKVSYFNIT
jgi:integrin alpha 8